MKATLTRTNKRNWITPEANGIDLFPTIDMRTPGQCADDLYAEADAHDTAADDATRTQDWRLVEHHSIAARIARSDAAQILARIDPTNRAYARI